MAEELGVTLNGLVDLGSFAGRIDRRRDTMHCFHADIDDQELRIDLGEIDEVRWFSPDHLPPNTGRHSRSMVALLRATVLTRRGYSHSIVPGGLLVMSSTTRPTGRISLIIRDAICSSRS